MSKKIRAIYLDGEPQNLAAGLLDALNWLRFFEEKAKARKCDMLAENRQKLTRTIALLEPMVADIKMQFQESPTDNGAATVVKALEIDTTLYNRQCIVCGDPITNDLPGPLCAKPECSEEWQRRHAYRAT